MSALGRTSALDPSDVRQDLGTPLTSSTARYFSPRRRFCDCPKGGQGFSATSTLTATTYMGRRAKYLTNDERASAHRADNTRHYQRPSPIQINPPLVHKLFLLRLIAPTTSIALVAWNTDVHDTLSRTFPLSRTRSIGSNKSAFQYQKVPALDGMYGRYYRWPAYALTARGRSSTAVGTNTNGWVVFMNALREEVVQLLKDWESLNVRLYHSYHAFQTVQNAPEIPPHVILAVTVDGLHTPSNVLGVLSGKIRGIDLRAGGRRVRPLADIRRTYTWSQNTFVLELISHILVILSGKVEP
ncbi:hypothetical protein B0H14DRAFT_2602502 [Mycena olivaceomarginata]|nr:hypothetical protein B0H14DRAFT_2602502 [Mycena olivaceomarginata]